MLGSHLTFDHQRLARRLRFPFILARQKLGKAEPLAAVNQSDLEIKADFYLL